MLKIIYFFITLKMQFYISKIINFIYNDKDITKSFIGQEFLLQNKIGVILKENQKLSFTYEELKELYFKYQIQINS